jgi:lipopolysaccharide/colanic/teichoic acid biosynthesis glycosyltransferase
VRHQLLWLNAIYELPPLAFNMAACGIMKTPRIRRLPIARRSGFQLLGALLFAGILPYLTRLLTFETGADIALHTQTLGIVCLSTILGYWFLRNFVTYPGVEKTGYILTSFAISYGIFAFILIISRIEYSRFMLICGLVMSIAWFYVIGAYGSRRSPFCVGLAPLGDGTKMPDVIGICWRKLEEPGPLPSDVDAVSADLRVNMPDAWERALADYALSGVPVYHTKHLRESLTGQVDLEHISENNFGSLSPVSAYMMIKHGLDRITAFAVLIVISPLLIVCCAFIKMDSPGPALFRQRRIGYQGKPFTVLKLRTMTVGATGHDERSAAMTMNDDMRVTRIGRFLRISRLDEIPQLINVLRGQMSWIGPRPEAEVLSKWYESEIPFYRYRHIVRPGITGWAQVNQGHVTDIGDIKTKLNFDFYYIKNFSASLDVLIFARTIVTIVTGFGAR